MAIVYDKLMALDIPTVEHSYTAKDSILYALGIGIGHDPMDSGQLSFVYEKALQAVPTMAVVLAHPGLALRDLDTGIDYLKVVHGEQGVEIHKPLMPSGTVIGRSRITGVIDKGEGRGALIMQERKIYDKATDDLLATISQTTFARADGGFGGPGGPSAAPHTLPDRDADYSVDLPTVPQAALLYRLSADLNPLHADPDVAKAAGFARPILHGLATYGVAAHAVLRTVCDYDATRLKSLQGRFTAPVYPGETFRAEVWLDDDIASFRIIAQERGVVAMSNGRAQIA